MRTAPRSGSFIVVCLRAACLEDGMEGGAFQQAMEHRFIGEVERLTRRRVAQFMSVHHVGPDLELELFVLEP